MSKCEFVKHTISNMILLLINLRIEIRTLNLRDFKMENRHNGRNIS